MKHKKKNGRKLLSVLLTLAMVIGLLPRMGMTAYAATWSGEGTQTNPYLISGLDDLIKLRDSVNAGTEYSGNYFRLTADIDCGADNWAPIGMEGYDNQGNEVNYYFKGIFDGNGKTVTYHVANADDEYNEYKGLFYKIPAGATVKNLSVAGFISGSGLYYGGIAGENGGTIQNCSSSVSITGSGYFYGGIAGINKKGTIDHCVASGVLTKNGSGYAYTAGIAGQNDGATVRDCVSLCDISAVNAKQSNYAGRVIGRNVSNGTAADCYYLSTANITGDAVNADNATGKTADEFKAIGETAYNAGYTVYAQALGYTPHIHNFTYSADGATISATCTADGCTLSSNPILTIAAPTMTTYGEMGKSAAATLTGLSDFNTATGKTIAETEIKYVGRGTTSYDESATAPTNAGTYTAKIMVEGQTASVDYEITKADPTTPTGLTATYGQILADVTLPDGWTWADNTQSVGSVVSPAATFKANFVGNENYNVASNVDVTVTVSKAANPATVTDTATVTKGGNTVDLADNVTLNGATGDVTYAINGEANGCSLSGSTLTSGDNTGNVTVNVSVEADNNYNALAATPITVTISDKGTQTITASDVTATYGDTNKKVEATTNGNGAISYAVKDGSADYIDVDASTGALTIQKVGTATVIVTAAETDTYAQATKEVTVTINKANAVAATVTANNRIYDGTDRPLVNVTGEATGGEMQYALGNETGETQPYTTSIPTATNAGTYYVWYKAVGDSNHTDSPTACRSVNIGKGERAKPDISKLKVTKPKTPKSSDGQITSEDDGFFTSALAYSKDDGTTWIDVTSFPLTGLAAGKYCFKYKECDNYKESAKSGNITLVPANELSEVTLSGNTVYKNGEISTLSAATNKNVDGLSLSYEWYRDNSNISGQAGETYTLTSADVGTIIKVVVKDSIGGNSVSTSIPEKISTVAPVGYNISGVVKNSEGSGLSGASVNLKKGDYVVATATTDTDGKYSFQKIPAGQYNVVVTESGENGKVKTAIAMIESSDIVIAEIKMPAKDVSSKLVVNNNDESGLAGGTVVGGLDEVAETKAEDGASTTVTMTVESEKDLTSASDTALTDEQKETKKEQTEIKNNATAKSLKKIDFLDLSIIMRVESAGAIAQNPIEDTGNAVLEIIIPYQTSGRNSITAFRKHGNTAAVALAKLPSRPTSGFQDGKFYVGNGFIVIYATKFSTYAIGYSEGSGSTGGNSGRGSGGSSSGGGGGSSYIATHTIFFDANGGTGNMASQSTSGTTVLKANTFVRDGYSFTGWNTKADGTGQAYADKAAVTPTSNMTLYAQWKKDSTDDSSGNDSSGNGGDSGNDVSGNNDTGNTDVGNSDVTANGQSAYMNGVSINSKFKVSQTGSQINVSWGSVQEADGYEIYVAYCGQKYGSKPVKTVTRTGVTSATIKKLAGKKLNLKKSFKLYVIAYKLVDGEKQKLGKTLMAHTIGQKNAKYTNVKRINLKKSKVSVNEGNTWTVKASVVLVDSKKRMLSDGHAPTFRYASSNKEIATVDKNGKVTAKKKGTCYIWVYARNGYAKKIKFTVK